MKPLAALFGLLLLWTGLVPAAPPESHFEYSHGVPDKLVWQTGIGPSYYLFQSRDLVEWSYVPSFPQAGTGGPMEYPFTPEERGFFRIIQAAPAPAGFAFIPAGPFQMGDAASEGAGDERPVHTVFVSDFFMATHEVTVALWDEVRLWTATRTWPGFDYHILANADAVGFGPGHPVRGDGAGSALFALVLQWCNARSEKEGLTPCYWLNGKVYRDDQNASDRVVCNWAANGYRLPTEAEWEKAARGGQVRRRFATGDTISHATAAYRSIWRNGAPESPYDVSPTSGFHPAYKGTGVFPGNAPVGSFAPNGYGLYDMTGNVREWCWDWYAPGYYAVSGATDPRGPATGTRRTLRGGAWLDSAETCRLSRRDSLPGFSGSGDLGFRLVRRSP